MKTVTYSATALKELASIDRTMARRIRDKTEQYAADPASLRNKVEALKGFPGYRLRVGDYRVIFTEDAVVVLVVKVGHRREVYR